MSEAARTEGSDILRSLSPGIQLSVHDVAVLMIVICANIAITMPIDLLGLDRINSAPL